VRAGADGAAAEGAVAVEVEETVVADRIQMGQLICRLRSDAQQGP